jgi:phosphomevalonate kinase
MSSFLDPTLDYDIISDTDTKTGKLKRIILISGKRTCGKDTITKIISNELIELGYNVCVMSYAGIVKENFSRDSKICYEKLMNNYAYKELHRDKMTNYFIKMRNEKGEDYFSKKLMNKIDESDYDFYIISDLRLKIDAEAFEKSLYDYLMIRVSSTNESRTKRGWMFDSIDKHFTETELDDYKYFDKIIQNDGSLDELTEHVKSWTSDNF